jgi:hypothetical protein
MVLNKISGQKRDEIISGCRKLHNEELQTCMLHSVYKGVSISSQTSSVDKKVHYLPKFEHHLLRNSHLT